MEIVLIVSIVSMDRELKIVSINRELNTDQHYIYYYNYFKNLQYKINIKGKYLAKALSRNYYK